MSLSSHLDNPTKSPIGRFFRSRFPNTRAITSEANARLRTFICLLPETVTSSYPYALIGMAVDYRLRYFFAITPPTELVAWHGAKRLVSPVWPSSISRGKEGHSERGIWYDDEIFEAFFATLTETTTRIQPVGRAVILAEDEILARYCFILSLFEQVYRSRQPSDILATPVACHTVAELLAIPDPAWIADICQLARLFFDRHADLLARPFILNPTFVGSRDVGGADADLLVDGRLIDIKTTKASTLTADWIRQLVGYALLDYDDVYAIRSLGLYLARHGELLTWPIEDLLRTLASDDSVTLASLRNELRNICKQ